MTYSSTMSNPLSKCEVPMAWFCFAVAISIAFFTASCDLMVNLSKLKFMIVAPCPLLFVIPCVQWVIALHPVK